MTSDLERFKVSGLNHSATGATFIVLYNSLLRILDQTINFLIFIHNHLFSKDWEWMFSVCTNRTINIFGNDSGSQTLRYGGTFYIIFTIICMYVFITAMNDVAMLNLIVYHSYLAHAYEEYAQTCYEEFVRILQTCDKYEMGKLRFNSAVTNFEDQKKTLGFDFMKESMIRVVKNEISTLRERERESVWHKARVIRCIKMI